MVDNAYEFQIESNNQNDARAIQTADELPVLILYRVFKMCLIFIISGLLELGFELFQ